jgi:ribosomal protein S27AE
MFSLLYNELKEGVIVSKATTPLIIITIIFVFTILYQTVLNKKINYMCGNCGYTFSPSPFSAALTPHSMGRKLLTCPRCGKKTWAKRVRKEN